MSRTPYRGRTPEARPAATGTPGTPGIPCSATSVPGSVVRPAGDNAETGRVEGAAQLGGTDSCPIEFARPTLASTVLPTLAAPPAPDADTPPPGLVAETNSPIPKSPGVTSAGFSSPTFKRPRLLSAPMVPATKDSTSCVTPTVAYPANMASRKVKSSGMKLGIVSACSAWVTVSISSDSGSVAWLTAAA